MPRSCTICGHPDREAIDQALVAGTLSNRRMASHYDVTERAVRNHKANHLPASLAKAQEAEEVAQADELLGQMQDLQKRTLAILEAAEDTNQHRTALAAIREARSNLELLAKLLGELDERPHGKPPHLPRVAGAQGGDSGGLRTAPGRTEGRSGCAGGWG